ncbi:shikimate kinase [Candidatus Peregrinibacteria bacterium CG10_big_fil_rev_8_21_14_0_10_36_19]|nr:MAG: shikimate kinase [Candidatus Peregrinibacteria bacterium CG10_big_fil_rev_8_21_14_0_10_36_19]
MNLILVGLRGSGKSTLGKKLAEVKKCNFVDTDTLIEIEENKTIAKIIEETGWDYFRKIENKVINNLKNIKNSVIATGGGVILNQENVSTLKRLGKIIYLHRTPEECLIYTENDSSRPALTNHSSQLKELEEIYKIRNEKYKKSSNSILQRTNDIEKDLEELIKIWTNLEKT